MGGGIANHAISDFEVELWLHGGLGQQFMMLFTDP